VHCLFVSDLHGEKRRYRSLFNIIEEEQPDGVFFGGDLLPGGFGLSENIEEFIHHEFLLKITELQNHGVRTRFFLILGNDDPRIYEKHFLELQDKTLITYVHNRTVPFKDFFVTGYSYIPPSPFTLKDWEKYDVSHYVDPGSIPPEQGSYSINVNHEDVLETTIKEDLKELVKHSPPEKTIYLFHTPPYRSKLDRAALDGKIIDHVPFDVHVGSIALQRFIKQHHPFITLHGHIHESVRLTGAWHQKIGSTHLFSAAHDGPELAVVRFDTNDLDKATRELV
jgi:Icc-related predicted phosphoesterase